MISLPISSLDGIPIVVDIIPRGNPKVRPAHAMTPTEIAEHNTGNSGKGADALSHAKYLHNNSAAGNAAPYASWHFTVDDKRIVQHIPLNESAWHTGDGSGVNSGNRNAIGVEIAENSDGDYAKAEANAVVLTAYLMKAFKIKIDKVKPHQAYSGKYCPHIILTRDGSLEKFKARVVAYSGGTSTPAPKPKPSSSILRLNDKGTAVTTLQKNLIKHGYKLPKFGADGHFGKETEDAVKAFQKDKGLTVDGLVGSATQAELKKAKAKPASTGIKQVGTVQIVNLNSFTYIYEKTNKSSKRVGEAKKGAKFPIAGSVPNWYEVIHNGKRAYIDSKYCKLV